MNKKFFSLLFVCCLISSPLMFLSGCSVEKPATVPALPNNETTNVSESLAPRFREDPVYADVESCVECHRDECNAWKQSDHSRAMDHADESTVLGDFSDVVFSHFGFDDLLTLDDAVVQKLIDAVFQDQTTSAEMREYESVYRGADSEQLGLNPVAYNVPGRKFKPPLNARFDDFALACFDAKDGVAEKLQRLMNDEQRAEFDAERQFRTDLEFNRPGEIATAQSRIVHRLQQLLLDGNIILKNTPESQATFRMYRDGEKFMVETDLGVHEVLFTLGVRPLQQYLIETEGGRLQCLPVAWDSVDRRWFHLYPKEQIPESDPLHWSKPLQNWNYMCADCHTTGFAKGFSTETLSYRSTFTENMVGCQSCHGSCGKHVETALKHDFKNAWDDDVPKEVFLLAQADGTDTITSCALCHTRRRVLCDGPMMPDKPIPDHIIPEMLDNAIYYPDGQLFEEAFELGSFMQSKMFSQGVACINCHDAHTLKLKFEGNKLCTQCHVASIYDTVNHHFHPDSLKPGTQCVECHFPQSTYMIADPRRDHSIRKPSPALTMKIGVPNACNLCHCDRQKGETLQWAADHVENWYTHARRSRVGYATVEDVDTHFAIAVAAGRNMESTAREGLIRIIEDQSNRNHRDIVRASALALLGRTAAQGEIDVFAKSLEDRSFLVRLAAIDAFARQPVETRLRHLVPLLSDPLLAIRLETVRILAEAANDFPDDSAKIAFARARDEYVRSQLFANDHAASFLNLGVLEYDLQHQNRQKIESWFEETVQRNANHPLHGNAVVEDATKKRLDLIRKATDRTLEYYRQSLKIDPQFIPSRINLAMLHNERGELDETEKQFKEVLRINPEEGEAAYSLGLLMVERGKQVEAIPFLQMAVKLLPDRARIRYNYGLLLMQLERRKEALPELEKAAALEPDNTTFLYALVVLHLQNDRREEALQQVERLITLEPDNMQWMTLKQSIFNQNLKR